MAKRHPRPPVPVRSEAASFVWPGDTLRREVAKLESQRAHTTLKLELNLKHMSELEAELEHIDSSLSAMRAALSAMRTANGGANG